MTIRTDNNRPGPNNRTTFWWVVLAFIVIAGLAFAMYKHNTTMPNATTTVGDNTTGINAQDGNTTVTPQARDVNGSASNARSSTTIANPNDPTTTTSNPSTSTDPALTPDTSTMVPAPLVTPVPAGTSQSQ